MHFARSALGVLLLISPVNLSDVDISLKPHIYVTYRQVIIILFHLQFFYYSPSNIHILHDVNAG